MGLLQELQETFVPVNDNVKVKYIKIKNTTKKRIKIYNLVYYINPVLGEDEINKSWI